MENFNIKVTNYYKFLKERVEMFIDCNEDKYEILNDIDKDTIIQALINDDELNNIIDDNIIRTMNSIQWARYEEECEE